MPYISNDDAIAILNQAERGGSHYDNLWNQLEEAGYVHADYRWWSPEDVVKGYVKRCKHCGEWFATRQGDSTATELGCFADEAPLHYEGSFYKMHEAV